MGTVSTNTPESGFSSLLEIMTNQKLYQERLKTWSDAKEAAEAKVAEAEAAATANGTFAAELTCREKEVAKREAQASAREQQLKAKEDALAARMAAWTALVPQIKALL